jgi:very-short-patch-repair endonuclease
VFVRERPGVRDQRCIGSPPRTTVEDTVLDLCDAGSAEGALGCVTRAVQERRTTTARLGAALAGRRRARHRALLRDLLADVAQGAETPLEIRYLRDVERAHRLPAGQRQDQLEQFWRDVAYEEFATVVELDGRLGHDGLGRFRDMARDNRTVVRGQATLRYGVPDVMLRPCAVPSQVALVLQRGGWTGTLVPCPHCPPRPIV